MYRPAKLTPPSPTPNMFGESPPQRMIGSLARKEQQHNQLKVYNRSFLLFVKQSDKGDTELKSNVILPACRPRGWGVVTNKQKHNHRKHGNKHNKHDTHQQEHISVIKNTIQFNNLLVDTPLLESRTSNWHYFLR